MDTDAQAAPDAAARAAAWYFRESWSRAVDKQPQNVSADQLAERIRAEYAEDRRRIEHDADALDALEEAARNVVANARIISDRSMGDATDIYSVPTDDVDALNAALDAKPNGTEDLRALVEALLPLGRAKSNLDITLADMDRAEAALRAAGVEVQP